MKDREGKNQSKDVAEKKAMRESQQAKDRGGCREEKGSRGAWRRGDDSDEDSDG